MVSQTSPLRRHDARESTEMKSIFDDLRPDDRPTGPRVHKATNNPKTKPAASDRNTQTSKLGTSTHKTTRNNESGGSRHRRKKEKAPTDGAATKSQRPRESKITQPANILSSSSKNRTAGTDEEPDASVKRGTSGKRRQSGKSSAISGSPNLVLKRFQETALNQPKQLLKKSGTFAIGKLTQANNQPPSPATRTAPAQEPETRTAVSAATAAATIAASAAAAAAKRRGSKALTHMGASLRSLRIVNSAPAVDLSHPNHDPEIAAAQSLLLSQPLWRFTPPRLNNNATTELTKSLRSAEVLEALRQPLIICVRVISTTLKSRKRLQSLSPHRRVQVELELAPLGAKGRTHPLSSRFGTQQLWPVSARHPPSAQRQDSQSALVTADIESMYFKNDIRLYWPGLGTAKHGAPMVAPVVYVKVLDLTSSSSQRMLGRGGNNKGIVCGVTAVELSELVAYALIPGDGADVGGTLNKILPVLDKDHRELEGASISLQLSIEPHRSFLAPRPMASIEDEFLNGMLSKIPLPGTPATVKTIRPTLHGSDSDAPSRPRLWGLSSHQGSMLSILSEDSDSDTLSTTSSRGSSFGSTGTVPSMLKSHPSPSLDSASLVPIQRPGIPSKAATSSNPLFNIKPSFLHLSTSSVLNDPVHPVMVVPSAAAALAVMAAHARESTGTLTSSANNSLVRRTGMVYVGSKSATMRGQSLDDLMCTVRSPYRWERLVGGSKSAKLRTCTGTGVHISENSNVGSRGYCNSNIGRGYGNSNVRIGQNIGGRKRGLSNVGDLKSNTLRTEELVMVLDKPVELVTLWQTWRLRHAEKSELQRLLGAFGGKYDGSINVVGHKFKLNKYLNSHPTQKTWALAVAKRLGSLADISRTLMPPLGVQRPSGMSGGTSVAGGYASDAITGGAREGDKDTYKQRKRKAKDEARRERARVKKIMWGDISSAQIKKLYGVPNDSRTPKEQKKNTSNTTLARGGRSKTADAVRRATAKSKAAAKSSAAKALSTNSTTPPSFVRGKNLVLTGVTNGMGREYALCLAAHKPARVFILCRDAAKGFALARAMNQLSNRSKIDIMECDFTDPADLVEQLEQIKMSGLPIHLVVCNAAALVSKRTILECRVEEMFAVNYLSAFTVCRELVPEMAKVTEPCRVVITGCDGPDVLGWKMDFTAMHGETGGLILQYARTKLMTMMLVSELNRRFECEMLSGGQQSVTINMFHPGSCNTNLLNQVLDTYSSPAVGSVARSLYAMSEGLLLRTPAQAITLGLYLCCSMNVGMKSGGYWSSGNFAHVSEFGIKKLRGSALVSKDCKRLYNYSVKVVETCMETRRVEDNEALEDKRRKHMEDVRDAGLSEGDVGRGGGALSEGSDDDWLDKYM